MADRNPILPPVSATNIQFKGDVLDAKITTEVAKATSTANAENIKKGKVVSYSLSTRTGTATIDTQTVSFRDSTLRLLTTGDNIVLGKLANDAQDWVVVGVLKPDTGTGTAPNVGIATISTGFPINTNAIPFPINPDLVETAPARNAPMVSLCYDMSNALGLGSDTIIGPATGTAGINLLSRTTGTATALYTSPVALDNQHNVYIQSSGTMFVFTRTTAAANGNKTLYYRTAGAGSWTSQTYYGNTIAFDQSTGWLWFYNAGWFKFAPTDTTPVSVAFATTVTPTNDYVEVTAGRGKLVVHTGTGTATVYHKNSNDTVNWTTGGTYATANWDSPRTTYFKFPSVVAGSDAASYYMNADTGTTTWHVRKVTTAGTVSDVDLNISTVTYFVQGYLITAAADVMFYGTAVASAFGGSGSEFVPYIGVFDPGSGTTVFAWYDLTRNSTTRSQVLMTQPVELGSGTFRWGARDYAPAPDEFWVYEGII